MQDWIDVSSLSPKVGNFALAWIVTKFTEPIRFAVTLAITPMISRWIRGEKKVSRKLLKKRKENNAAQRSRQDIPTGGR